LVFADFFSLLTRVRGQLLSHPVRFDVVPRHPAGQYLTSLIPIPLGNRVPLLCPIFTARFSLQEFFGLIPTVLLNLRQIGVLLSDCRARIALSDVDPNPDQWRFYFATLRLLASISELAMVIPYRPAVAQHYEVIIALAVGTLCKSPLIPCQLSFDARVIIRWLSFPLAFTRLEDPPAFGPESGSLVLLALGDEDGAPPAPAHVFYPRGHPLRARLADYPDADDFVGEYCPYHFPRPLIPPN
jgi:hypothetical protein